MTKQPTPQIHRIANRKYQCDDIQALHRWLEAHGYRFYGQHDPGEYGRFSRQEAHDHDEGRTYVHSFIQVWDNGEIYSPDEHAWDLLNSIATDAGREREVG